MICSRYGYKAELAYSCVALVASNNRLAKTTQRSLLIVILALQTGWKDE
jgi:hypothetical protein